MSLKDVVIQAICEKKAMDVREYDCREITPFVDTMVVGTSNIFRHSYAIAKNIKDRLKEANLSFEIRIEGKSDSKWLLVDLGSVVVHLFVKEEREVYQIDRLYADCPVVAYEL